MKCDFCSKPANIEILTFIGGQERKIHMCADCYREKMQELIHNMPEEWGGAAAAENLQKMFREAEKAMTEGQLQLNLSAFGMPNPPIFSKEEKKEEDSARSKAFEAQLQNLKKQREELTRSLQWAMEREDYERCAEYRDRIAAIGDALIRLNEERKDPYGV